MLILPVVEISIYASVTTADGVNQPRPLGQIKALTVNDGDHVGSCISLMGSETPVQGEQSNDVDGLSIFNKNKLRAPMMSGDRDED